MHTAPSSVAENKNERRCPMKKYRALLMVIALAVMLMPVFFAVAQAPAPIPTGRPITLVEITDLINRAMQILVTFGVVIGVIFIAYGGITYMLAGDNAESATKAKDRVKNGLIGVGIVLGVGVLIQTVQAIVTRSFFN